MQHEEIRQAVRRFAQEQLAPNAARWDREKHFPREALKGLAAMGLYGVAIAEKWDGAGLDYTSLAVACEEIAAGDCSTATIVAVNNLVAGIEEKTGQRASDTAQIVLENCQTEHLLGGEGAGYRIALANLESGRINVAPQSTGVARAALEAAIAYARERKSMGKTLIEHQAVNFRLADMATRVEAGRQLYLHAASLRDAGRPCIKEASMAKLFASEMAEQVCSDAIQIHGGYGYVADFPVERLWRDVRVTQIYEGASDIQRLVIGRALEEG